MKDCGMRSADCGLEKAVALTSFGWTGVLVSDHGIVSIVLPKKDKKAVEKDLNLAGRRFQEFSLTRQNQGGGVLERPAMAAIADRAIGLLQKYFSGESVLFDLPLDLRYYTVFQKAAWLAAAEIPYGMTQSYSWIARRIQKPRAFRAVGQAMGANPVPIMIP